jgi:hypothetical protein
MRLLRHALPGYLPTEVAYTPYQHHWPPAGRPRAAPDTPTNNKNNNKTATMTKRSSTGSQDRPDIADPTTPTPTMLPW